MAGSKKPVFDASKPYATVHGGDDNSDRMARFEQNHELFDATKQHIGPAGSKPQAVEDEPEVGLTSGKGNLGKGEIPKTLLPLEEGGAGGGETKSFPQTTDKGRELLDEAASDAAATSSRKK